MDEDYAAADADVAYANQLAAESREDQLRQLLSYYNSMSDGNESGDAREAYDDAAAKLAAILDGEG